MKNTKFNNEEELQSAWNELSNSRNQFLEKGFIINSINSKSKLSIMEIKKKFKKELIIQLVAFGILLYFAITSVVHNSIHIESSRALSFYIIFFSVTVMLYGFLTIRQYKTFRKLKDWQIDTNSTLKQITDSYEVIKFHLKFDKYWKSVALLVPTFLALASYWHDKNHSFSMLFVLIICGVVFAMSFGIVAFKNKRKYGGELKKLKDIIDNAES